MPNEDHEELTDHQLDHLNRLMKRERVFQLLYGVLLFVFGLFPIHIHQLVSRSQRPSTSGLLKFSNPKVINDISWWEIQKHELYIVN